mgnify:CR=1 FL=1
MKLGRQLQGKRHSKIELCVKLSLLRLFHVDHVVQNKRSALSLAWYEWFSCKDKEWIEDLLLRAPVVFRTSNMKILRRRLAEYVKTLHQKACRTCSTIIFFHSTIEIIDLWWRRRRCRRTKLKLPGKLRLRRSKPQFSRFRSFTCVRAMKSNNKGV